MDPGCSSAENPPPPNSLPSRRADGETDQPLGFPGPITYPLREFPGPSASPPPSAGESPEPLAVKETGLRVAKNLCGMGEYVVSISLNSTNLLRLSV